MKKTLGFKELRACFSAKPVSTFAERARRAFCITMRRLKAAALIYRTSLERIAAESALGEESDSVHRDI
jgi:hypothetical protein